MKKRGMVGKNRFKLITMTKLLKFPPKWLDFFVEYAEENPEWLIEITQRIKNQHHSPIQN